MHPILFKLGPVNIYSYGTAVAIGFIAAFFLVRKLAKHEGINPEFLSDFSLYVLIAGLIGGRLVYILTDLKTYIDDPIGVFRIWEGGLVFYGGLIFGIIAGIWYLRKNNMNVIKVFDLCAPGLALAHAIGRLGCFFRGCCYGKVDAHFGLVFPYLGDNLPHLPTQIMESAMLFIICLILFFRTRKKKYDGEITWLYLLMYSIARFIVEIYRMDFRGPMLFDRFSVSQAASFLIGILALFMLLKKKNPAA